MNKYQVIEGNVLTMETSYPDSVSRQQTVAISAEVAEAINHGETDDSVKYIGIGITSNYLEFLGFIRGIVDERGFTTQTEQPVSFSKGDVIVEIYQLIPLSPTTIRRKDSENRVDIRYLHDLQNKFKELTGEDLDVTDVSFGSEVTV